MHLLRKRTVGHLALLMATVLFVVACGAPPTPPTPPPTPPPAPTPTPTPFTVVSTSPAAGQTMVTRQPTITITFSAPLWNTGLGTDGRHPCTAGNIVVAPLGTYAGFACAITFPGTIVTLTGFPPANMLPASTPITVTVLAQVANNAGVPLGTGFAFSFTTGP